MNIPPDVGGEEDQQRYIYAYRHGYLTFQNKATHDEQIRDSWPAAYDHGQNQAWIDLNKTRTTGRRGRLKRL